jgi:murein L,D-transpeptidase YafK
MISDNKPGIEDTLKDTPYISFQKSFVAGNQYIEWVFKSQEVRTVEKRYWWEVRLTFNIIDSMVERLKLFGIKDSDLWGENKIVDKLIPLQRFYNTLQNTYLELLNSISQPTLAVEDGSVDVDELTEEGLAPGKVLIYRQGAKAPVVLTNTENNLKLIESVEKKSIEVLNVMEKLVENYTTGMLPSSCIINREDAIPFPEVRGI